MSRVILWFGLILIISSCNQSPSIPIYHVPNPPSTLSPLSADSTTISIKEFYIDDNCIGESYSLDSPQIYFQNIQSKKTLNFIDQAVLYFNGKEVDFRHCFGKIPNHDIFAARDSERIDIKLSIVDFEYNCTVPSYAFQDIRRLTFSLNFKDAKKCCNETYFGNGKMETLYKISGNYSTVGKNKKKCKPEYTQWLEIIQQEGQGARSEDWLEYEDTFEGRFKHFNGTYESALNETDFLSLELRDSAELVFTIYNAKNKIREEKGEWIYRNDFQTIDFHLKNEIKLRQGKDTINLKHYALMANAADSSGLVLMTYRIEQEKIKPFEFLALDKQSN